MTDNPDLSNNIGYWPGDEAEAFPQAPVAGLFYFRDGHEFLATASAKDPRIDNKRRAREIIREHEKKHGLPPGTITGPRRDRLFVEARFDAIAEVALSFPSWSLPQLGRLFNRDHTTILASLRKRAVVRPGAAR